MNTAKDLRVILNLAQMPSAAEEEIPIDFTLTETEKKSFFSLVDCGTLEIRGILTGSNDLYRLVLKADGDITLKDAHDGKEKPFTVKDEIELAIDPFDEENSDLMKDKDGNYDLRGSILALLYDAIPRTFSTVPLTRCTTDDYVLFSEEEYEEEKRKRNNPFAGLDAVTAADAEKPHKKTKKAEKSAKDKPSAIVKKKKQASKKGRA
jgi:hypothetical protein